jgi:hypothetical protein
MVLPQRSPLARYFGFQGTSPGAFGALYERPSPEAFEIRAGTCHNAPGFSGAHDRFRPLA